MTLTLHLWWWIWFFGGVDSRENVFNVVGTLTVALRFLSVRDLLGFGCS